MYIQPKREIQELQRRASKVQILQGRKKKKLGKKALYEFSGEETDQIT
jgi:hypothetical protein